MLRRAPEPRLGETEEVKRNDEPRGETTSVPHDSAWREDTLALIEECLQGTFRARDQEDREEAGRYALAAIEFMEELVADRMLSPGRF